jgi:hypothetical protein
MTTQPDGRTARQIKHAPPGAFFVWSRTHVSYALSLAKALGRHDLAIVPFDWKGDAGGAPVVYDHECPALLSDAPVTAGQAADQMLSMLAALGWQGDGLTVNGHTFRAATFGGLLKVGVFRVPNPGPFALCSYSVPDTLRAAARRARNLDEDARDWAAAHPAGARIASF